MSLIVALRCTPFRTPTDLADVSEESIKELGFSRQKARAIKELALRVRDGTLDLESP